MDGSNINGWQAGCKEECATSRPVLLPATSCTISAPAARWLLPVFCCLLPLLLLLLLLLLHDHSEPNAQMVRTPMLPDRRIGKAGLPFRKRFGPLIGYSCFGPNYRLGQIKDYLFAAKACEQPASNQ